MNRRGFLQGMAGILAAGVAPAVLPSGIIMPIRKLWTPKEYHFFLKTTVSGGVTMGLHGSFDGGEWFPLDKISTEVFGGDLSAMRYVRTVVTTP